MRITAPASNVRLDYAARPKWMGKKPRGPAAVRCIRPRALAIK